MSDPPYIRSSRPTPHLFELVCPACGDDLGPMERQPAYIRRLRGPYEFDEAVDVASRHAAVHTQQAHPVRGGSAYA